MNDLPFAPDTALSSLSGRSGPAIRKDSIETLKKSAQDFEAFFLSQMVEHMFEGIKTDGLFGGGPSEGIYRSMMVQEYGKLIAARGGIGLADSVVREVLATQEVK